MMNARGFFFILLLLPLNAGCVAGEKATRETPSSVEIRVTNRSWLAMDVYLVGQSRRVHLGRLASGRTERYRMPGDFLASGLPVRFEMVSANQVQRILTDEIVVTPGEDVILIIPNER